MHLVTAFKADIVTSEIWWFWLLMLFCSFTVIGKRFCSAFADYIFLPTCSLLITEGVLLCVLAINAFVQGFLCCPLLTQRIWMQSSSAASFCVVCHIHMQVYINTLNAVVQVNCSWMLIFWQSFENLHCPLYGGERNVRMMIKYLKPCCTVSTCSLVCKAQISLLLLPRKRKSGQQLKNILCLPVRYIWAK